MYRYFGGIDPGQDGAVAIIDSKNNSLWYYKVKDDDEQCTKICTLLDDTNGLIVAIEDVRPMHLWGISSTFAFGWSTGYWHGVCDGLKINTIPAKPKEWQELISKPPKRTKNRLLKLHKQDIKKSSIKAANKLFPGKNIRHDGIADAVCIAEWCKQQCVRAV